MSERDDFPSVRPLPISVYFATNVSSRGTSFIANEGRVPAVAVARREKVNKFLLEGPYLKSRDAVTIGDAMRWSMVGANKILRESLPGGGRMP